MGYRHKLGLLDKEKHSQIKDMTVAQLKKWYGDDYVPCYEITNEVYELGKYYDDNFVKTYAIDVFSKPATNKYYKSENDFYIISKDGFKAIIDRYRKNVLEFYEMLLKQNENDKLSFNIPTYKQHIEAKIRTWGENCEKFKIFPYEIEDESISTCWEYEYAIFELVRIYKTVNWDKQLVTITAW